MRWRRVALAAAVGIEILVAAASDFLINEAANKADLPLRATLLLLVPVALIGLGVALWTRLRTADAPALAAELAQSQQALVAGQQALAAGQHEVANKQQVLAEGQEALATGQAVGVAVGVVTLTRVTEMQQAVDRLERRALAGPGSSALAGVSGVPRPVSFVGRTDELRVLQEGLRAGTSVGVFALRGMAGVGKSALAAVVVTELAQDRDAFPGGGAWVSCDGLAGPEGLAELWNRVARELGMGALMEGAVGDERRVRLTTALQARPRTLLALDNVEPGLDAEAALNALALSGHTAVLLTAREQVASHRLRAIDLPPLPDPDAERLFRERLALLAPERPSAAEAGHIPALVEAVGGLPLAVELVAAYAAGDRLLLEEVEAELQRDGVNAAAFRADPTRVLTTRFDRSFATLSGRQQRLFAGLALMAGPSLPRAAAEALGEAAAMSGAEEAADPSGDLAALIYYALVEPLEGRRLRLHPLLRDYAGRQLRALAATNPVLEARLGEAMLAYWLAYARTHPGYEGMSALESEAPGLMGALEWAHDHERHRDVLALAYALNQYWSVRGRVDETRLARPWALDAAQALGDATAERITLHDLALFQGQTGHPAEARAGYDQALALARQLSDPAAEWVELHSLAVLDANQGKVAARAGFEQALALARQLGDPAAERADLHCLAALDAREGKWAVARAGYERALALARQLGDPDAERRELHARAVLDANEGRRAEARAGYEQALALARQLGDLAAEWVDLHSLAALDADEGKWAAARAGFEQALALARQLGDLAAQSRVLQALGADDTRSGADLARARSELTEALALARQVQQPKLNAEAAWLLAELERLEGNIDAARAGFREALTLYEQLGDPNAAITREQLRKLEGDQ
jgi:tetratricopeptide (TPR) repeat protein